MEALSKEKLEEMLISHLEDFFSEIEKFLNNPDSWDYDEEDVLYSFNKSSIVEFLNKLKNKNYQQSVLGQREKIRD